jgi:hypothetical protein
MPDETISQVAPQKSAGLAAPPGLIIESPAMQDGHPVIQVAAAFRVEYVAFRKTPILALQSVSY